ncbi:MAG: 50S ribosomal protein L29 [Magnetococcales bacterium]|nr:50S ribosomal protein L29 [Magnetococcales bacterium]
MKAAEIRELTEDKVSEKLKSLYHEAMNLRFQNATNQLENVSRIRLVRKEIARIKTIAAERSSSKRLADKER